MLLRGFVASEASTLVEEAGAIEQAAPFSPAGHAWRLYHVCRYDQLRPPGLGIRPQRVSL